MVEHDKEGKKVRPRAYTNAEKPQRFQQGNLNPYAPSRNDRNPEKQAVGLISGLTAEDWLKAEQYFKDNPNAVKLSKYAGGKHEQKSARTNAKKSGWVLEKTGKNSFIKVEGTLYAIADTECLGEGAFGKVRVVQTKAGKNFAMKIEGAVSDTRDSAKRQEEHRLMRLIKVLHGGADRDYPGQFKGKPTKKKSYTIMNLAGKTDVLNELYEVQADKLQTRKPPMKHADKLKFAIKATQAIQFLHRHNIIHGDIKPANFMINHQNKKIVVSAIDFGFSMQLKDGQDKIYTDAKGSLLYMAPEIAKVNLETREIKLAPPGQAVFSFASDIYALGTMFLYDFQLGVLPNGSPSLEYSIFYDLVRHENADIRWGSDRILSRLFADLEKQPNLDLESQLMIDAFKAGPMALEVSITEFNAVFNDVFPPNTKIKGDIAAPLREAVQQTRALLDRHALSEVSRDVWQKTLNTLNEASDNHLKQQERQMVHKATKKVLERLAKESELDQAVWETRDKPLGAHRKRSPK